MPSGFDPAPDSDRASHGRMDFLGLGRMVGTLAAVAAGAVGVVLTLVFAATLALITVLASVVVALIGFAWRFRRRPVAADGGMIIEARKVGHAWVAYGWDQNRR
jgi:membrane protein implicated in regulation of membrane protease activity